MPTTTRPEDETPATEASAFADDETVVSDEPETLFELPSCDNRERSLPIRQGDLNRLLMAEPWLSAEDRDRLTALGRFMGATFHSEFYDRLRELKELYAPLDPDNDYIRLTDHTRALNAHSDEEFLVPLEKTLEQANYRVLDNHILEDAVSAPNEMGLNYVPNFELFEHLRVYVRGYTRITRERRTIQSKFRKQTVHLDAYQRLLVVLKFKADSKFASLINPNHMYLRLFKDVPHVDMEMYLPEQGTKVRMRKIDYAQVVSPFVVSIPTICLKIAMAAAFSPALTGSLVVAPISAGVNSFFGHQRARQKHFATMIHRLYYQTLANNASVLTRLIDSAEDEEYKEAALAYFFLWRATDDDHPLTVSSLDDRIEKYLLEKTGVTINFDAVDAIRKLLRLGLAFRDSKGGLHATPLDQALRKLDRLWDDRFRFS